MDRDVKRHPIRGALWGLLFGLGLYLLLVELKVFVIGSWGPVIIAFAIGVVLNVLWSMFAPAKAAKPPKGWTPSLAVETAGPTMDAPMAPVPMEPPPMEPAPMEPAPMPMPEPPAPEELPPPPPPN